MVSKTKMFNGKKYSLWETQKDKRIAIQHKKKLIVKGYLVRVVPTPIGYAVYTKMYSQR